MSQPGSIHAPRGETWYHEIEHTLSKSCGTMVTVFWASFQLSTKEVQWMTLANATRDGLPGCPKEGGRSHPSLLSASNILSTTLRP